MLLGGCIHHIIMIPKILTSDARNQLRKIVILPQVVHGNSNKQRVYRFRTRTALEQQTTQFLKRPRRQSDQWALATRERHVVLSHQPFHG